MDKPAPDRNRKAAATSGGPKKGRRAPSIVRIHPKDMAFLAELGADPKGPGSFRPSAVLRRTLSQFAWILAAYAPAACRPGARDAGPRVDPRLFGLIGRTVPEPWRVTDFEMQYLWTFCLAQSGFAAGLTDLGIALDAAKRQIDALSFVERVALLDAVTRTQVAAAKPRGAPGEESGVAALEGDSTQ